MTNEGTKGKRSAPYASTAGICLSVVNIGSAPTPNVPRQLQLVNYFQELELTVLWDSVLADFRPFLREVGGMGKEEEMYGIDRKSKSK